MQVTLGKVLLLALAGALGTVSRVYVGMLAQRLLGPRFPWGTLSVNLLGCFAYGLVWSLAETRGRLSPDARALLLAGFMGAFTTFSSYVFDSYVLVQGSRASVALLNVLIENLGGILCLIIGLALGRLI
jgi:CrcB protein